jgi:RecA-family ATPase
MALNRVALSNIAHPPLAILVGAQNRIYKAVPPAHGQAALHPAVGSIVGFTFPQPGSVGEGFRNDFLARAAGHYSKKVKSPDDLASILGLVNQIYCSPPLDDQEVGAVARSIGNYIQASTLSPTRASTISLDDGLIQLSSAPKSSRATLWGDMVFPGKYSILAGPGGTSKTMLAIGLGVQVCLGQPWCDEPVTRGAALLVLGEEDADEVNRRVNAVLAPFHANEQNEVRRLIRVLPAAGKDIRLVHLVQNNPVQSDMAESLIKLSGELATQAETPVRLIVLDHARLVGAGDNNDASHVTELTRVLTYVAQETGAAVVLIGHSPKSVHGKTDGELSQSDVVGSGAFVDNARSALLITTLSDAECKKFGVKPDVKSKYARMQVVKNNYGRTGSLYYFERRHDPVWQVAPLEPVKLAPTPKGGGRGKDQQILQDLAGLKQLMSRSAYCERRSGSNGPLGISEKQLRDYVGQMLMRGQLVERPPSEAERLQHKL